MAALAALVIAGVAIAGVARAQAAEPFPSDLTPGYVLIEGDIQVPLEVFQARSEDGIHPASTFGPANYWGNNVVPFDFVTTGTGTVLAAQQTAAINAMNAIAERAGVIFRPATSADSDRIRFQASTRNSSPVGRRGGTQIINITNWNSQIIICHEIYHSLGFQHEQSRPDRDTYVTIVAANICGEGRDVGCPLGRGANQCCACVNTATNCISCLYNFDIVANAEYYGPYDFDSFMHYDSKSYSCNSGDTIVVNPPWNRDWQDRIGQRDHFSRMDILTCRALYPFPKDRWLDRAFSGTPAGTFRQPYKHTSLAAAIAAAPEEGTLLIKHGNTYAGVGTYDRPITLIAPDGDVYFGD